MHVCPEIGPSMPCAECTRCRTFHIPVWFGNRRRPQEIIFRRQGYMKAVGKAVEWWWEWVPVTPLDGSPSSPEFVRGLAA